MNVCQDCGACCAALRVSFHQRQTSRWGGSVPAEFTEPFVRQDVAMRGTMHEPRRCVALVGDVGRSTSCSIYSGRPSNCAAFEASWAHGEANPYCDEARSKYGLRPLTPEDWTT